MTGTIAITSILLLFGSVSEAKKPFLVISYIKTPCFGQCPDYTFELYSDCKAYFEGRAFTDKLGKWRAKVPKDQYLKLKEEFESSNFFAFEDRYYAEVSDLPTTYIYYSNGQEEKKIMDYYKAPEELKNLEKIVENLILDLKWKKK